MTVKSLLSRIEKLEKAIEHRERPSFVLLVLEPGETLDAAIARCPALARDPVFAAAISCDHDATDAGTGGRGWLLEPPAGRA